MAVHPVPDTHNRSIGELFGDLSQQTRDLISEEIALAKAEIREKISRISRSGVWFGVAGVMAFAGLLTLLATAVLGLTALGLQPWLSALIVAVVVLVIAFVAVQSGRSLLKQDSLAPKQTLESLKENAAWIRSHTS
jgi:cation transport ATPase